VVPGEGFGCRMRGIREPPQHRQVPVRGLGAWNTSSPGAALNMRAGVMLKVQGWPVLGVRTQKKIEKFSGLTAAGSGYGT